jgi:hypothetical protein
MSGIEFLDEVADRPADRTPPRQRRWWLVGGLALALVIVWALTRPVEHARSMPEAVPAHVPLATSSPTAPEEQLCREEPNCQRTTVVPLVLRKVINRYLPGPVRITVHSYLTKSLFDGATYLVARRIDAAVGPAAVAILVRRDVQANLGPPPPVTGPSGVASVLVRGDPFGYVVDLQYLAPPSAVPSFARLRALATEPGLESM